MFIIFKYVTIKHTDSSVVLYSYLNNMAFYIVKNEKNFFFKFAFNNILILFFQKKFFLFVITKYTYITIIYGLSVIYKN